MFVIRERIYAHSVYTVVSELYKVLPHDLMAKDSSKPTHLFCACVCKARPYLSSMLLF